LAVARREETAAEEAETSERSRSVQSDRANDQLGASSSHARSREHLASAIVSFPRFDSTLFSTLPLPSPIRPRETTPIACAARIVALSLIARQWFRIS